MLALPVALLAAALLLSGAPAARGAQYRGTQISPYWADESVAELDRQLDLAREAGANVVRANLGWASLQEDGPDEYSSWYLARADTLFEHARQRGLEVLPNLWGSPCWASSAPPAVKQECDGAWWRRGVTKYPPTDVAAYAEVARFAAARWGRYMAGLQIWNEPNHSFWVTSDQVGDYVRLAKTAYPAIKRAQPALPVVAGALSGADGDFLEGLYRRGVQGSFDVFSIHPYSGSRPPEATASGGARVWSFASGVPWIRKIMLAHGDDKPLWLSEFGWTTCQDRSRKCVTPEVQGRHTSAAWRVLADWSYVWGATQYQLRDNGTDRSSVEENYGLVGRDYAHKPAYQALVTALAAQGS